MTRGSPLPPDSPGRRLQKRGFVIPSIGGGERLVLTLARAWNATVYTTEAHPASVERLGFGDVRIVSLGSLIPQPPLKQVHASFPFSFSRVHPPPHPP